VEFRESIKAAISQTIALLGHYNYDVRSAGADVLARLSDRGKL
jgi:hypothetical protein